MSAKNQSSDLISGQKNFKLKNIYVDKLLENEMSNGFELFWLCILNEVQSLILALMVLNCSIRTS